MKLFAFSFEFVYICKTLKITIMKKVLLILFVALMVSCEKDEGGSDMLEFIQVKVTSDDAASPAGVSALFYLGDDNVDFCRKVSDNLYMAKRSSDGEMIYPVSKAGGEKLGKADGYSVNSFYWSDLSTRYGTPKAGRYAVYIQLNEGKYPQTYKVFTIDKNKVITAHIPKADDYGDTVESTWTIADY